MKKIFLLLAFLLVATEAHGTRYWASTAGGAGSCGAASGAADPGSYRTLTQAIACATASGDEVYMKPGTYTTAISGGVFSGVTIRGSDSTRANWPLLQPTTGTIGFEINTSSSARSNITIQYIKVDMSATSSTPAGCFAARGAGVTAFITIQDFECQGPATATASDTAAALGNEPNSTNWSFKRGKVFNWLSADANPGAHGGYLRGTDGLIEHLHVSNTNGYCIQLYSATGGINRWTIRNNVFTACGDTVQGAGGLRLGSGDSQSVYNNLIVANTKHGIHVAGGSSHTIYNNVIYGNAGTGIIRTGSASITNNIIAGNGTSTSGSGGTMTTNSTSAACMIDATGGNYNLVEGSACIDAGTTISGFSEGRYVGAGVDQGAFEAPIRSSAVVEDATDTIYRITFSLPTQSTRDGTGLQTCTVGNIAVTVAGAGATESSCSTSGSSSRVDVTLGAAVTVGQALTDAYTRSTAPSLMDNVAIGDPNGTLGTNYHNAYVRTYGATAGTNNVDGGALPAFTQTRYRFHKLRGTEASPSLLNAAATENVSVTLPPGAAFRLRVKFRTDDNPDATTFKLRYSKDAGAYTDIPDTISTDNIGWYGVTADTDIPAAGTATTELLTSDEATNVACAVVRTSSDYPLLDFNNGESECEYVLKISTSATVGTTYDFRVYKGDNTALDTYSVTPRLTVGSYTSFGF